MVKYFSFTSIRLRTLIFFHEVLWIMLLFSSNRTSALQPPWYFRRALRQRKQRRKQLPTHTAPHVGCTPETALLSVGQAGFSVFALVPCKSAGPLNVLWLDCDAILCHRPTRYENNEQTFCTESSAASKGTDVKNSQVPTYEVNAAETIH